MASLISGFEYDVFISYRQKDNKYDGWVTEFVNNLKKELEATFKEDVSVYFDINPHDGLLETHDVGDSLKEKIKCLVFIPIISRTYCDPKSFAWEHEFKAFVEQASRDQFSLKVKLSNGNIASRILPVRIHDLDEADISLCESVTGGVLRGVEFIYKEPGVNRSLTPKDKEKKNLNGTIYRNQINKVALAIKEIILGLQAEPTAGSEDIKSKRTFKEEYFTEKKKDETSSARHGKRNIIAGVLLLVLIAIAGIYFLPSLFKKNSANVSKGPSDKRICVVVMPFSNMTGDSIWNNYQAIIQQSLITSLTSIGANDLRVRIQSNVNNSLYYSGYNEKGIIPVSVASEISKKLNADILIYGMIQKSASGLAINTQLVELKSNEVIKSITSDGQNSEKKIFDIIEVNRKQVTDFLIMSKIIKDNTPYGFDYKNSTTTTSSEAVRYFFLAKKAQDNGNMELALDYFLKSNSIDSNFYDPYIELPAMYSGYIKNPDIEQNYKWLIKAYSKRDQWPEYERLLACWEYAFTFESPETAVSYLEQVQKMDDEDISSSRLLAISYSVAKQYENAIKEYAHFRELYSKWDKNWDKNSAACGDIYISPGYALYKTGQFNKAKECFDQAEKLLTDSPVVFTFQAVLAFMEKDTAKAERYISKLVSQHLKEGDSEAYTKCSVGDVYAQAGMQSRAKEYYRKALLLDSLNIKIIDKVTNSCFQTDLMMEEIPVLLDNAMRLEKNKLNYYNLMDSKGWAEYKLGNIKEAYSILKKVYNEAPYKIYSIRSHYEEVKKAVEEGI
jgi:tetratricopeptide (TPR) repeat protein